MVKVRTPAALVLHSSHFEGEVFAALKSMKTSAPGHLHGLKLFTKVQALCGVLQSLQIADFHIRHLLSNLSQKLLERAKKSAFFPVFASGWESRALQPTLEHAAANLQLRTLKTNQRGKADGAARLCRWEAKGVAFTELSSLSVRQRARS